MTRVTAVDVHVAGEPLRVITGGFPEPQGTTIFEKRRTCREQHDHLRRALMLEPRGHADMYGALLVPSCDRQADFGVLFMHNAGYSTMCGHGIIGLTLVLVEKHMVPVKEPITSLCLETPSGLVTARAQVRQGRVQSVSFHNVPSFAVKLDDRIDIPDIGVVRYDLAFGGAFYALCSADDLQMDLRPDNGRRLIAVGTAITNGVQASRTLTHPRHPDLGFLYGTIFIGRAHGPRAQCRQVCVFADGALDRSPTGTGVSAHLAVRAARNQLADHTPFMCESILGTLFRGTIVNRITEQGMTAIIPEIEGMAYVTGEHEFLIDPNDPLREGFRIR